MCADHDFEALIHDGDLATIAPPIDFLGVNHYHDDNVSGHPLPPEAPRGLRPTPYAQGNPFVGSEYLTFPSRGLPRTAMGWEINPGGLQTLLVRLGQKYPSLPPLYVTENGSAWEDVLEADGAIDDRDREDYLRRHLDAVSAAIDEGADVRGYFVWSLLDNFEWAWGYDKRFGIVHVDYDTLKRTIKRSGHAYARIIADTRAHATARHGARATESSATPAI